MAMVTERQGRLDDLSEHPMNAGAGGKYCASGSEREENSDESAEWGGEDMEELEEEEATEMGAGEAGILLTVTEGVTEESVEDGGPGSAAARGSNTGEGNCAASDKAGVGGHHGAKTAAREKVAGQRKNPSGKSYGAGGRG